MAFWDKLKPSFTNWWKPASEKKDEQADEGLTRWSRSRPARKLPPAHGGTGGGYLSEEYTADFLEGQVMFVHSSNVVSAQYFADMQQMVVAFGDGTYMYYGVSEYEAETFATATSKGRWVWDVLRVRGSATAHKKPYKRVN